MKEPSNAGARMQFGSSRHGVPVVSLERCLGCGLVRQVTPPSPEDLRATYARLEDPTYADEEEGRRRTFERSLRLLRRALPPTGRLLDVGCSTGVFLQVAARDGWEITGVEPSYWAAREAAARVGDVIYRGLIEDVPFVPASFDLVTLWDVLEHTVDPARVIAKVTSLAAPGGLVVMNVPAADSTIARLMRGFWPLILPEHLFYFTRSSLVHLLNRFDFEILSSYQHLVFFSLPYVLRRLSQHGLIPGTVVELLGASRAVEGRCVPLLMGERMLLAGRRKGS